MDILLAGLHVQKTVKGQSGLVGTIEFLSCEWRLAGHHVQKTVKYQSGLVATGRFFRLLPRATRARTCFT